MVFDNATSIGQMREEVKKKLQAIGSIEVDNETIVLNPENCHLYVYKIDDDKEDVATHLPYELTPITNFHDADSLSHILLAHLTENVANIGIRVNTNPEFTDTHKLSIIDNSQ